MFDLRNAMVDLEESFTDWRWQMLAAGFRTPELVEELEQHLREEVEQQLRLSADGPGAFAAAIRRMGPPSELKREFNKTGAGSLRFWWVWLGIGAFGLMQTAMLNFVGPLVFHRHSSLFFSAKWWADWFPSYIVWLGLILVGSAIGVANRRARRSVFGQ